jgi:hypothetical protein
MQDLTPAEIEAIGKDIKQMNRSNH